MASTEHRHSTTVTAHVCMAAGRCCRCAVSSVSAVPLPLPQLPQLTDLWAVCRDLVEAHHGGCVREGPQGLLKIGCRLTPSLLVVVVVVRDDVATLLLVGCAGAPCLPLHAVRWYCNDNSDTMLPPLLSLPVTLISKPALSLSMWKLQDFFIE